MKLELDPTIRPEFQTYHAIYEGGELGGATEVWVCKTSNSFGISQSTPQEDGSEDEDIILLDRKGLLKLQVLVNQAVELLEDNNAEGT